MTSAPPRFPIRVYYEDTDAGGVVYYANYLKFAERARTEALRSAGISQHSLAEKEKLLFVVGECKVRYHSPARLDDALEVETLLQSLAKVRMTMQQNIWRGQEKLASLEVTVVAVDAASFKATKIPDELAQKMCDIFGSPPPENT